MQEPPESWDDDEGSGGGNSRGLVRGPAPGSGGQGSGPPRPSYSEQTMRSLQVGTRPAPAPPGCRPALGHLRRQKPLGSPLMGLRLGRAHRGGWCAACARGGVHYRATPEKPVTAQLTGAEIGIAATLAVQNIDEASLNYELVESLVCHIVEEEAAGDPAALSGPRGRCGSGAGYPTEGGGAILIFMTGAAEIDRTVGRPAVHRPALPLGAPPCCTHRKRLDLSPRRAAIAA